MGRRRPASIEDTRAKKRLQLVERTVRALSLDSDEDAIKLLSIGRCQSVRINTLKGNPIHTRQKIAEYMNGEDIPPSPLYVDGITKEGVADILKDTDLQREGYIYVQNAASWLPVLQLQPIPGESILDACAAPGGKTSLIAALADNKAIITANDNSRPRLMKLKANIERLGGESINYTLHDAAHIARALQGQQFDKILLDAPCSGEGMMRYDKDKDFDSWSVAHIKRLSKLQKKIIMQAWYLLKPGGSLVYSTCTMAPEENEAVVDYLLRRAGDEARIVHHQYSKESGMHQVPAVLRWGEKTYDERISDALRLAPSYTAEAFFVCHIQKATSEE